MNMKQRDLLPSMSFPDEGSTYAILRRSIRLTVTPAQVSLPAAFRTGTDAAFHPQHGTTSITSLSFRLDFTLPLLPCHNSTATHNINRRIWPQLREQSAFASRSKWCLWAWMLRKLGGKNTSSRKMLFVWLKTTCRIEVIQWSKYQRSERKSDLFPSKLHDVRDARAFARMRAARILPHAAPPIWAKLRDCNVKGGGRAFSQLQELLARCHPFTFTTSIGWTRPHIFAVMYLHR